MLKAADLKLWLCRDLPRLDKLLLVLATFEKPCSPKSIKERARAGGLRAAEKWNISSTLGRSEGLAIGTPEGWELSNMGKSHLNRLGVSEVSAAAIEVAADLRRHLDRLNDGQTREFVEEAIKCHEAGLYRSAVVMSWLGAVDVLHKYVHANLLVEFNVEASKVHGKKWRAAISTDDLGRMAEGEFLERLAALSVLGKNVKTDLKTCLDRRNGCGHPNSLRVSTNQSAAHIETLLLNVFEKFS